MRTVVALLLVVTACSQAPSTSAGTTASPTPLQASASPVTAGGSYAVLVKDFLEGGPTYTVSLVGTDGHVAASATPKKRSRFVQIGNVSTSATTLYYLDGDFDIHYLRPDGNTGVATQVAGVPNQVVAFAVRPDDRRIAIAVLDYTRYPVSTSLYVEDLNGGGNHLDIFSSSSVLEWPIGWHQGGLVMAFGINGPPQNIYEGFTLGQGSRAVVDAYVGARLQSICEGGDVWTQSLAGTECIKGGDTYIESWNSASRTLEKRGSCNIVGPMSSDGIIAARVTEVQGGGCSHYGPFIYLVMPDGSIGARQLVQGASPDGWLDSNHLLVLADTPLHAAPDFLAAHSIVDIATGSTTVTQATGFFAAALPGGL